MSVTLARTLRLLRLGGATLATLEQPAALAAPRRVRVVAWKAIEIGAIRSKEKTKQRGSKQHNHSRF
jgi:hypothetical protein